MSKFCIDLKGVMLPDAIAAVVEAWYDAQNVEVDSDDWVEDLRLRIKREFGRGWIIRSHSPNKMNPDGKCQLTRIAPDRSRNSVVIPVEWRESNAALIYNWVKGIYGFFSNPVWECSTLQDAFLKESICQDEIPKLKSKKMQCSSAF